MAAAEKMQAMKFYPLVDGGDETQYSIAEITSVGFERIVTGLSKENDDDATALLLEVYAPWCDVCKARKNVIEGVAEYFNALDTKKVPGRVKVRVIDGSEKLLGISEDPADWKECLDAMLTWSKAKVISLFAWVLIKCFACNSKQFILLFF